MDDGAERIGEAGDFKRALSIMFVNVELAALRASTGRGLRFIDGHGNAMDVEDAGEDEAAEARTDDRDWWRH